MKQIVPESGSTGLCIRGSSPAAMIPHDGLVPARSGSPGPWPVAIQRKGEACGCQVGSVHDGPADRGRAAFPPGSLSAPAGSLRRGRADTPAAGRRGAAPRTAVRRRCM
jgi:hypothetical protein